MADDIVERLRAVSERYRYNTPQHLAENIDAAADEIERLQAEVERLRAEREDIDAIHYPVPSGKHDEVCNHCIGFWPCTTHLLLHPEEARRG